MNWTTDEVEAFGLYNFTNVSLQAILMGNRTYNWYSSLENLSTQSNQDYVIIVSYSIIILVSIFGNLLVCNILARSSRMRSSTYIFIANLALSDFLLTVLNIPFNVARLLLPNWPFGSFMCSFVPLVQVTSVYVSTFTMTCIAGDRYRIVKNPLKPRLKRAQAIKAMVVVWLLAIILALPHAIFNRIEPVFTFRHMTRCRTVYPVNMNRWIILTAVSTQYVLPLAITAVFYWRIMVRIWSRNTLGVVTEGQLIVQARAKKKTIKMLVLVVILFAICWLPLNIFNILREFDALGFIYRTSLDHLSVFFICHWLAMSSVCYNPFIYCWLNDHFRSGALSCLLCIKNVGQRINSSLKSTMESRINNSAPSEARNGDADSGNDDEEDRKASSSKGRRASCRLVRRKSIPMCIYFKTECDDAAVRTDSEVQKCASFLRRGQSSEV